MVSKPTESSTKFKQKSHGEQSREDYGNLVYNINQLKKQIQMERIVYIKEKFKENGKKVENHVRDLLLAATRNDRLPSLLFSKIEKPLIKFDVLSQGISADKDSIYEFPSSMIINLPYIERLPPYTTWIFLHRNQKMTEDQSVVGRRRIYYDQHGSEALICSDSEEEVAEPEEEKYYYSKAEDRIIWMAFEEHGCNDDTANILSQFVGGTVLEIQDRYKVLKEKHHKKQSPHFKSESDRDILLAKTLDAALDSFDNLFCRRCMLFDCCLHGCSQSLIYPSEKQPHTLEVEDDEKPCSDHCYLQLKSVRKSGEGSTLGTLTKITRKISDGRGESIASCDAEELTTIADDTQKPKHITVEVDPTSSPKDANNTLHISTADTDAFQTQNLGKRKVLEARDRLPPDLEFVPDDVQVSAAEKQKKLKTAQSREEEMITGMSFNELHGHTSEETGCFDSTSSGIVEAKTEKVRYVSKDPDIMQASDTSEKQEARTDSIKDLTEPRQDIIRNSKNAITEPQLGSSNQVERQVVEGLSTCEWRPIERELYLKGVEIFGRNSCLIARNMLSGLKTCIEVSRYMRDGRASVPSRSAAAPVCSLDDNEKADVDSPEREMPVRARLLRRRSRTRKLKYSWKSGGHPSMWKRIADGKNQSCKQYIPCGCQFMCGKQCPCLENGTCCEKYCGCSKSCKNRFRGCHCAKSQCRSRQCPCFAAGRECDPDVCRNCWVSCGDGSLGEPPRRGEGQCGNMRLLLRQQQRILLAKSDVAGWGAFLKNAVNKNDYLGEYTGELISHREADKRGKIYDRANSSFLFDLNDQYVLDAFRKGDKLKFANHSSNPNCYAKVMLVAGDHRVGIFAKDHIDASEELFYDYRYGPDQAPAWARKPEGSKRDDSSSISQGRAKKHQSH